MDTVKSIQETARSDAASPLFQSTTREAQGRTASTSGIPEVKRVFELRTNIGKRFVLDTPLIRITPDKEWVKIESYEDGVWTPVLTTPFYFDLAMKED